ncbi:SGNH/GDSL hydrolase family protein [Mucilaginibacter sp. ZT4R22]|uniref:SGNH/GDSL hydrolase family protein n=1 Tax=Mucilaginibacter pankratovii TaxID=2772110 RepID=A0ABR7WQ92_9SPHI|nr:SGNH/GDSL hydrolase family protein [Mucilaginibacter pankratovii]MBD1364371.1 SGNH/GDSL hydrolase family protein [Mucilaginibacter pankratovii]
MSRFAKISDLVDSGFIPQPSGLIPSFKVDYEAAGDGVTDDLTPINTALLAERVIEDSGDFHVSAEPTNKYGTPINGDVRIIKTGDVGGQPVQLNTDADRYQYVFGLEYLSSFHKKLIAGTDVKIIVAGDSTSAYNGGEAGYDVTSLLTSLIAKHNISGVTLLGAGEPGATNEDWADTYLAGQLAQNPDLLLLRYGINDANSGLTPKDSIDIVDTALASIRADSDFTADKLAIILCTPNTHRESTASHPSGEIWIEEYRRGLKALARQYQCIFFDTYAMWQDARHATDYMNDSVHPQSVFYAWQASRYFDVIFPEIFRPAAVNTIASANPYASTDAPEDYRTGVTQFMVSGSVGGEDQFPVQGQVITFKAPNGLIYQLMHGYGSYGNVTWYRSGQEGGDGWFAWTQLVDKSMITGGIYTVAADQFSYSIPIGFPAGTVIKSFSVTASNEAARAAKIKSATIHYSNEYIVIDNYTDTPLTIGCTIAWTAIA